MANETPSRPPPFMANAILNFHFDYRHTSLTILGSIAPSGAGTTMISLVGCCLVLFFKPKMNCVKMSDVSVDFHCTESRQWFVVLHS